MSHMSYMSYLSYYAGMRSAARIRASAAREKTAAITDAGTATCAILVTSTATAKLMYHRFE